MLVLVYDVDSGGDDFMDTVLCAIDVETDMTDPQEFEKKFQPVVAACWAQIMTRASREHIMDEHLGFHEVLIDMLRMRGYVVTLVPTAIVTTE